MANNGAQLPALPNKFDVCWVDFEPNRSYDKTKVSKSDFRNAVRLDKGRRVLAGMMFSERTRYFMIVDDDDLISNNIASYVDQSEDSCGWYIKNGYIWSEGSRLVIRDHNLVELCGSTLIVRSDLYRLPKTIDAVDEEKIKRTYGSHVFIRNDLSSEGHDLRPLPFPGVIYRVGHLDAHSQSKSMFYHILPRKTEIFSPYKTVRKFGSLGFLNKAVVKEFFGPKFAWSDKGNNYIRR